MIVYQYSKVILTFIQQRWQQHLVNAGQRVNIQRNIARGTTDPGYRIYNLNKFSGWNQFDIILTKREEKKSVLDLDMFIVVTIEKAW